MNYNLPSKFKGSIWRLHTILLIVLLFSQNSLSSQNSSPPVDSIRTLLEGENHVLYLKITSLYRKRRLAAAGKDSFVPVPHVTPNQFLYSLVSKNTNDTMMAWGYSSTGRGAEPLWIYDDGTVVLKHYSTISFLSIAKKKPRQSGWIHTGMSSTLNMKGEYYYVPKEYNPALGDDKNLIIVTNNSPYRLYSIPWKSVKKGNWNDTLLVGPSEGLRNYYNGYILRDNKVFSYRNGKISIINLKNKEKKEFDFLNAINKRYTDDFAFIYYSKNELLIRFDNGNYVLNIENGKIDNADGLSPNTRNPKRPDYPKDYGQSDSIHVVIRDDKGVLMQSEQGRLYLYPWMNGIDMDLDFDKGILVSHEAGIDHEEIQKYLKNVNWQKDYIASVGENRISVYNISSGLLKSYSIPDFNNAKHTEWSVWEDDSTRVSTLSNYPDNWSEVHKIMFIQEDYIIMSYNSGYIAYNFQTGELYNPFIRYW